MESPPVSTSLWLYPVSPDIFKMFPYCPWPMKCGKTAWSKQIEVVKDNFGKDLPYFYIVWSLQKVRKYRKVKRQYVIHTCHTIMQLNMYVWHDGFLSLTWQNCFEVLVSTGATLSLTHLRRLNSSKPWPARLSLVIKHFKMACYEKSFQGIHNWLRKDFDWKRNSFSGAFPPLFNCNHIRNTFQTSFSSETQSAIELLGNTLRQYISLGNNLIFCWATSFVVAILFGKNLFLSLLRFIWQQVWTNVSLQSHSYFELAHFSVGLSHTFYVASIVASLALNL